MTIVGNLEFLFKNVRYKLLRVKDEYYLLDMDRLAWSIVFPFIYWFVPHPVYRIDEATYEKLKVPGEKRRSIMSAVLFITGVSIPLGRFLGFISDRYLVPIPNVFTMVMFIVFIAISICGRLYVHCSSKRKINNTIRLDTTPKRSIKIRPTIVGFIKAFYMYFLFLGICLLGGYLYIEFKDFLAGVSFAVLLCVGLLANTAIIPEGSVKVTYLKDTDQILYQERH